MGNINPFGGGSSGSSSNTSGSSGLGTQNALAGLSDTFANIFASNAALSPDASGMTGFDVANAFGNLDSTTFNEDTATAQATQAITPPAQAQQAAATGQDPSAGIGGTQTGTQTASTGPSDQNQPSQDQKQRDDAIDELRRILRQRQKQQQGPPQWNPRYAGGPQQAAAMQMSGTNPPATPYVEGPSFQREYGPPGYAEGESNQPEYGPGTPGASYPEGTDYQTEYGHELNLPRPGAPALPDPSGSTGRQITVRPRAPLPARTVPGTPGAPPGTPGTTPETLPGPDSQLRLPPSLPAGLLPEILSLPLAAIASYFGSTTPAETGEFTPAEPNFVRPDAPVGNRGLPAPTDPPPAAPPPPPAPTAKRKDQPKPKPKAAEPPKRVWAPPTPGHYIPTPGNARGQPTWVPGTPGHYVDAHRSPPAAVSPAARVPPQRTSGAIPASATAYAAPTGGSSPMMREVFGGLLSTLMPELARQAYASRGGVRSNSPSNVYGQGGTRPYNENWGGAAYVAKGDEVQRGRQYMGYLTNKGLTRQGAAALLGNAHQESNLSATLAPGGDGGTAAGMFQWRGSRQAAFRQWLQANGRSESDPQAHLDFALYEMQTNPAYRASWDALHNPNMSPAQIADIIANNYEGSKRGPTQGMNNRIGFANSMLQGGGQGPVQASGGGFRITDPNQNPLTSHTYPAPGETTGAPALATGGDARS